MTVNTVTAAVHPSEAQESRRVEQQHERTPLLSSSTTTSNTNLSYKSWYHRLSSPRIPKLFSEYTKYSSRIRTRLIILALIPVFQFSTILTVTTAIDVFRSIVCYVWYSVYDPENVPDISGGIGDDGRCDVPGVNEWFSSVILIASVCIAIGAFLSSTLIGFFAPKIGRKPLQLFFFTLSTVAHLLLPLSVKVSAWFFPLWMILDSLSSMHVIILLIYMSITDLTDDGERTTYLLLATGLASLGMAPSFLIGGLITSLTGSPLTVFYVAAAALLCVTVIFGLTVEETFGEERRAERRKEREREEQILREQTRTASEQLQSQSRFRNTIVRVWASISTPFYFLGRLLPTRNSLTGRRNYRLFVLGISFFCGSFVTHYDQATIVYSTTRFHFGAKENGLLMSSSTTTAVIWLLILSPILLRVMEGWYRPRDKDKLVNTDQENSNTDQTTLIDSHTAGDQGQGVSSGITDSRPSDSGANHGGDIISKQEIDWKAQMIARRDVHVVMISYLLGALAQFCKGLARNGTQLILAGILSGCVGSAGPALRSAAVASVPPLQSGEILAAFELVGSIAQLLAPIQGVLLTLLINTAPWIVFFLAGSISLFAALMMLFVRERDRFIGREGIE